MARPQAGWQRSAGAYILPRHFFSPVHPLTDPFLQEFVAAPALAPPEVQVDEAQMEKYRQEMEAAVSQPLPDEDDADL